MLKTPLTVGLHEDAVDLFQIDDAFLVADGFEQGAQAEVLGAAQESFAGADDEGQGVVGEGVVAEAGAIELVEEDRRLKVRIFALSLP